MLHASRDGDRADVMLMEILLNRGWKERKPGKRARADGPPGRDCPWAWRSFNLQQLIFQIRRERATRKATNHRIFRYFAFVTLVPVASRLVWLWPLPPDVESRPARQVYRLPRAPCRLPVPRVALAPGVA